MEMKFESQERAVEVAQKALWLAYQNSFAVGLGLLHERGGEGREVVVKAATHKSEIDPRRVSVAGDYLFGRMVKLYLNVEGETLLISDGTPRPDYQSWAHAYPTYAALLEAAKKEQA